MRYKFIILPNLKISTMHDGDRELLGDLIGQLKHSDTKVWVRATSEFYR